jgi:hypothetical protein
MEVHISRIHSRVSSSSASLFDLMISKGVENSIANRSIETDMEIDTDFGNGFVDDNDCDPEEEVESLPLPAEPLIEIFHIENHPNAGKVFFSQNSQLLIYVKINLLELIPMFPILQKSDIKTRSSGIILIIRLNMSNSSTLQICFWQRVNHSQKRQLGRCLRKDTSTGTLASTVTKI